MVEIPPFSTHLRDSIVEISRRHLLLGLVFVLVVAYSYYTLLMPGDGGVGYSDLTVQQAHELIQARTSLVILDVRTQEEYDEGHIEGTTLITVGELATRLEELSRDDELLVYCRTGNRSSSAVSLLRDNGFTKIYHLRDGITAWIRAGYPIVK
jgi:rhodanese-related sulfurtransferase